MANTKGNNNSNSQSGKQGFASMSEEKRKEIASKGGSASHSGGNKSGNTK